MKTFKDFNARGLDIGGSDLLEPGTHRVRIDNVEFDPVTVMLRPSRSSKSSTSSA